MFIYHYLFTLVLKSPDGEWPITYIIIIIIKLSFSRWEIIDPYWANFFRGKIILRIFIWFTSNLEH